MSILQKLNTGGWDQSVVDELKLYWTEGVNGSAIQRIEATLDYEEVEENLQSMTEDRDSWEDNSHDMENKNDDLMNEIRALKNCISGARGKMEDAIIELERYKS